MSTPDRPVLSRSRKPAHLDATRPRVSSRLAQGTPRQPLDLLLNGSSQVRALAQLRRSLNSGPIQRVKAVTGGFDYQVGDVVSYEGEERVVVKVGSRYDDQTPAQWEYDVALSRDVNSLANGGELSPCDPPVKLDDRPDLQRVLKFFLGEESDEAEATSEAPPQRGENTRFDWNAGEAPPQAEVSSAFWSTPMPGVEDANRRQITSQGATPLGSTDVPGGRAWASHQVDFIKKSKDEYKKQTGGFTFNFEGEEKAAHSSQWLQFISIKMVQTKGGETTVVADGDSRVTFTTDDGSPQYGVDYSKTDSPYYAPSVQASKVDQVQKTMVDDPLPSVGAMRRCIGEGATEIVETDTFDTFLVQDDKVVYHGQLRVTFTCDASGVVAEHPVRKTSQVTKSERVNGLPAAMREALHGKYPAFKHIV